MHWLIPNFKKKTVLTNLGEKMTDEEVDELLKAVDTSTGEINYMGKQFLSSAPLSKGIWSAWAR